MKRYKFTILGLVISVIVLLYSLIAHVDLFETLMGHLHHLEAYEVDEFIVPFIIFIIFMVFDMRQLQRSRQIEHEKVKIYKAMLYSAHHVLNNFLNQMQIFKMEAENTKDFNPDILKLYNQIMKDASKQIDALGGIDTISELSIIESVTPGVSSKPGTH